MTTENTQPPAAHHEETMIDAKQAAASLCLPYYWFADQAMRAKYKIPHYLLGGLVRYRASELAAWAQTVQSTSNQSNDEQEIGEQP